MSTTPSPREVHVRVGRTRIAARVYGPPAGPSVGGIVLVHGGAAHQGWWTPVAHLLSTRFDVVTLDLSGHGDSNCRESYDFPDWAAELASVASVLEAPPVAVGHSLGGMVVAHAAARHPTAFSGVVALDTPITPRPPDLIERRRRSAVTGFRTFPDLETAAASFTPAPPPQDRGAARVREVSYQSFRLEGSRWVRKLDPKVFLRSEFNPEVLSSIRVPTTWFRAAEGIIDDTSRQKIAEAIRGHGRVVDLPGAGHHLLLDDPAGTAGLIATAVTMSSPETAGHATQ